MTVNFFKTSNNLRVFFWFDFVFNKENLVNFENVNVVVLLKKIIECQNKYHNAKSELLIFKWKLTLINSQNYKMEEKLFIENKETYNSLCKLYTLLIILFSLI